MKRLRLTSIIILLIAIGLAAFFYVRNMRDNDRTAPVINVDSSVLELSINDDESVLLDGVTAADAKDGDVTDSLVIEDISSFLDDGRRIVTYAAFDSDNHVSKATRQIRYTDYTSPTFALETPLLFSTDDTDDILEGVTATDCVDGDITDKVMLSQGYSVYYYSTGDTESQIEVTNSMGDTVQQPIMISVYDPTQYNMSPHIALKEYLVYTDTGKSLKLRSYIDEVSGYLDPDQTKKDVQIDDSTLDYNTPGTYFVKYSLENEDGYIGYVYLTVVVKG